MIRLPPRLRMFFDRLAFIVIAWFAMGGFIDMVRRSDYPKPWLVAAVIIGCWAAARFLPVTPKYRASRSRPLNR